MSDDVLSVMTPYADVAELGQGYMQRADGERLWVPLASPASEGQELRFVIHLADGTPAFAGAGRCVQVADQGVAVDPAIRFEALLDSLRFDERSQPVYDYIVAVRAATLEVAEEAGAEEHAAGGVADEVEATAAFEGQDQPTSGAYHDVSTEEVDAAEEFRSQDSELYAEVAQSPVVTGDDGEEAEPTLAVGDEEYGHGPVGGAYQADEPLSADGIADSYEAEPAAAEPYGADQPGTADAYESDPETAEPYGAQPGEAEAYDAVQPGTSGDAIAYDDVPDMDLATHGRPEPAATVVLEGHESEPQAEPTADPYAHPDAYDVDADPSAYQEGYQDTPPLQSVEQPVEAMESAQGYAEPAYQEVAPAYEHHPAEGAAEAQPDTAPVAPSVHPPEPIATGVLQRPAIATHWRPEPPRRPSPEPMSGLFQYGPDALPTPASPPRPALDPAYLVQPAPHPRDYGQVPPGDAQASNHGDEVVHAPSSPAFDGDSSADELMVDDAPLDAPAALESKA